MKAAVYHRYGPPDVVTVADLPRPAPSDGEMPLRVHAAYRHVDAGHKRGNVVVTMTSHPGREAVTAVP
jgi:NADPH:quinone reductase-like Zn-dependent oxidoreductase